MLRVYNGFKKHPDFLAVVALFFITVAFFARLFYPEPKLFSTAEIGANDIWYLNYPLKNYLAESLKQGRLPTWNPYRNNGFPDIAEGQNGTFNLYNLLAFRFLPTIHAFNGVYVLSFFTCALGTYLFARRKKFSVTISLFAALTYTFSGFFITHISHQNLLQTASFFPLLMWATDRILKQKSIINICIFSLILSQQLFSGFPQLAFISLIGVSLYALVSLIAHHKSLVSFTLLIIGIVMGVIISAVQILPTLELLPISQRSQGLNVAETLYYRFPFEHLLSFLDPFIFGNPQYGTYPHFSQFKGSIFWENTGYIGLIPLLLALFAITKLRKIENWQAYVSLLALSFLLMLGGEGPLYFLFTYPPFSFFRFPSRFLLIFVFALVFLSASGLLFLDNFLKRRLEKNKAKFVISLVVIASFINLFTIWYPYHPTVSFSKYSMPPEITKVLQKEKVGSIYTYLANSRAFTEFFTTGSSQPERYLSLRNELAPNLNVLFHLNTADAYASSITPKRLSTYNSWIASPYKIATISAEIPQTTLNLLNLRHTTHIISPIPLLNSNLKLVTSFQLSYYPEKTPLFVYKNPNALPAYYLSYDPKLIDSLESFVKNVADITTTNRTVFVEKKVNLDQKRNNLEEKIELIKDNSPLKELVVSTPQDAILATTISYYPGWEAYVDNQKTEIFPVNFINSGLRVSEGKHQIILQYNPNSIRKGAVISGIGYFLISIYFCLIFLLKIKSIVSRG